MGKVQECHFCHAPTPDDCYCYGCGEYVCDECGSGYMVVGKHPVSAHQPEICPHCGGKL